MKNGDFWTNREINDLTFYVSSEKTDVEIAEALNRSVQSIRAKIRKLRRGGLNIKPRHRGNLVACTKHQPIKIGDYPPTYEACQRHADAVMAQGGFAWLSERSIGNGRYAVCLPLNYPSKEV